MTEVFAMPKNDKISMNMNAKKLMMKLSMMPKSARISKQYHFLRDILNPEDQIHESDDESDFEERESYEARRK